MGLLSIEIKAMCPNGVHTMLISAQLKLLAARPPYLKLSEKPDNAFQL